MNIKDALLALANGKKITSTSFIKHKYIEVKDEHIVYENGEECESLSYILNNSLLSEYIELIYECKYSYMLMGWTEPEISAGYYTEEEASKEFKLAKAEKIKFTERLRK